MSFDVKFCKKDEGDPICPDCGTPITPSNESPNGGFCEDCGEDK